MSIADVTDVADTVSAGRTARFARETFGAGGRLGQKLPLAPVMETCAGFSPDARRPRCR